MTVRTNEDSYDQLACLIATCTIPITDPTDVEPLLPLGPNGDPLPRRPVRCPDIDRGSR